MQVGSARSCGACGRGAAISTGVSGRRSTRLTAGAVSHRAVRSEAPAEVREPPVSSARSWRPPPPTARAHIRRKARRLGARPSRARSARTGGERPRSAAPPLAKRTPRVERVLSLATMHQTVERIHAPSRATIRRTAEHVCPAEGVRAARRRARAEHPPVHLEGFARCPPRREPRNRSPRRRGRSAPARTRRDRQRRRAASRLLRVSVARGRPIARLRRPAHGRSSRSAAFTDATSCASDRIGFTIAIASNGQSRTTDRNQCRRACWREGRRRVHVAVATTAARRAAGVTSSAPATPPTGSASSGTTRCRTHPAKCPRPNPVGRGRAAPGRSRKRSERHRPRERRALGQPAAAREPACTTAAPWRAIAVQKEMRKKNDASAAAAEDAADRHRQHVQRVDERARKHRAAGRARPHQHVAGQPPPASPVNAQAGDPRARAHYVRPRPTRSVNDARHREIEA